MMFQGSAPILACLNLVFGLACAFPSGSHGTSEFEKHFSVDAIPSAPEERSGPAALAAAYHKYNSPLPAELENALSLSDKMKRDGGHAAARPEMYDRSYVTPVKIGNPPRTLNLDFDTGSSDLWVFSSLTNKSRINGQRLYDPYASKTAKLLVNETWAITYYDRSGSSGLVYTDEVSVGNLKVKGQAVEVAEQVSDQFAANSNIHGLLGLGFDELNEVLPTQQKTFFYNAMQHLAAPLFTVDLRHQAHGKYTFGSIDHNAYNGDITYTDIDNSRGYWAFTSPGYGVGDGEVKTYPIYGIADTGTTLLMMPDIVCSDYYSAVEDANYDYLQGGFTLPCYDPNRPDFHFIVGNTTITIPAEFMAYAPVPGGQCFGGLQSSSGVGFAIFGDVLLKAAFVVFDRGNMQIGWASK